MARLETTITIRVDRDFHKRLKLFAVERGTTIKALFFECLERMMAEEEAKEKK